MEELIHFFQELIQIPSLSGEERDIAQRIATEMTRLGYENIKIDALGNVIGIWTGVKEGPTVIFDGHMDVVPVTNPQEWQYPPFGGIIKQGRLWGRGAADTKGAFSAMIYGISQISKNEIHGRVVMVASVCEEEMTGVALAPLLDCFHPQVVVTGEPTGLQLGIAQKGRLNLELLAHGRSAHTSQPSDGINAVYRMIEAIQCLRALSYPTDDLVGPELVELTEILSDPRPGISFVPHTCKARLNARLIPGETRDTFLQFVHSTLDGLTGIDISVSRLGQTTYTGINLEMEDYIPGWRNSPENKWQLKILADLSAAGYPLIPWGAPCGTNASASAGLLGITSFIFGPGSLSQAHIVDEWVSLDEVITSMDIYRLMAISILSSSA